MMAKKITKIIKLALPSGKANPAPPIGPALGAAGCNIMMFCKEYNARTQDQVGTIVPVEISVFEDRSFTRNRDWVWPTDMIRQTDIYSAE